MKWDVLFKEKKKKTCWSYTFFIIIVNQCENDVISGLQNIINEYLNFFLIICDNVKTIP